MIWGENSFQPEGQKEQGLMHPLCPQVHIIIPSGKRGHYMRYCRKRVRDPLCA